MAHTTVIRYTTRPEAADLNARLVEEVFAEISAAAPDGLRYTTYRLGDGTEFIHVLVSEGEGNPLGAFPAFRRFQEGIGERCADGPRFSPAAVVGAYGR
ncbi:hypothetical protein [Catenuloplanes indicus]|uniref:Antibiotic biosynthesis monooxygenase n=1 Tax=Catenuloplanes indicus TaxID=137267 RepID=A0AAE3VW49_9ACTN|nr:hypothetical protein [Catenuloplanes indicus]MDQ0364424.1 hypothetical protein [Catenuloplanes indicus]